MRTPHFVLSLLLVCACVGLSAQVTAYQHTNYGGKSQEFGVGFHPGYLAIGNDVISSFRVKPGYKVIAYEHAKNTGRELVLNADAPDLIKLNFNDVISNLEVVKVPSTLTTGQRLTTGDRLYSDNGQYLLEMQDDGNLCIYTTAQRGFVWCSMKHGFQNARLDMQSDGNLVVYDGSGQAKWSSETHPYYNAKFRNTANKPVKLKLENNGTLALYTSGDSKVWSNK